MKAPDEQISTTSPTRTQSVSAAAETQTNRRGLLRAALGIATATAGAAALMETRATPAQASGAEGPTTFTSTDPVVPAITAVATAGANGISISTVNTSPTPGSPNGTGVAIDASHSNGAYGISILAHPASIGLVVDGASEGISVQGSNYGVFANCSGGRALAGFSNNIAVYGEGQYGVFAHGRSTSGIGLHADSDNANAVEAVVTGASQVAVLAQGGTGTGVSAASTSGTGVIAHSDSGTALRVEGLLQVAGNAVGQVTMAAGTASLTVNTPAATAASLVLITPLGNPRVPLWIGTRAVGSFTIAAGRPLPTAIAIQYLVVN